jgi:predicted TIM-barrel fold metal-dependent hydrolase
MVVPDVADPSRLVLGSDTPPLGEPIRSASVERGFCAAPDLADDILHDNAAAFLKPAKPGAVP